ncbi:MAG: DNA repair protein RecN [Betaproteobacteria bacterium]|nr:DNA repair protein RecN [Betaproteobacteria bacterium]
MLRTLAIRNFILVDQLEIDFDAGFSVLTGETGAGKSILVDALALVLGGRGDAGVVRAGAERAEISAEFDLARLPDVQAWLRANDLANDERTLLLRRVIDTQGRSRGYLNGSPASLGQLREVGELVVDIHGQHAHQSLLRPDAQRALLDAYGGFSALSGLVADAWRAWQKVRAQRELASRDAAAVAAERDALAERVEDLRRLGVNADEWITLGAAQSRLAHAAALIEGTQSAAAGLDDEGGILAQINAVAQRLQGLTAYDAALGEHLAVLDSARAQLQDLVHSLQRYAERIDVDEAELRRIEERLGAIHDMARKYRVRPEALPELRAQAEARLAELKATLDHDALARREREAEDEYRRLARDLSAKRQFAANDLSVQVTRKLATLAMAGGEFQARLVALGDPASYGLEQVDFLVSTHPGQPLGALARVASGGELSRLSLAVQVAVADVARVPVLIFDEVDVGIGGGVAETVGRLLQRIGAKRQVLCVTHLPQVAACADRHFAVRKADAGKQVRSTVEALAAKDRVEEVARMLGGVEITARTRAHAREMLAASGRD